MSATKRDYRKPLALFMVVVLGHWAEHILQAIQIWVFGTPRPQARGLFGEVWPWLVSSEALHYAYAIAMLVGLYLLRHAFTGLARRWWMVALGLQVWHHLEHGLLLLQAALGQPFFGQNVATSFAQLAFPRVELHLFYNAVVFTPMLVAIYLQFFDPRRLSSSGGRTRSFASDRLASRARPGSAAAAGRR